MRRRVLDAHGDAWQAEGRARAAVGGGAAEVRGARLMASGIAAAKWNNADVTADDVDVDTMADWYARRDLPWGVRVPLGVEVTIGTPLFRKPCVYTVPAGFAAVKTSPLCLRPARPDELDAFVHAEAGAFGDDANQVRRWLEPVFGRRGFEHWLALDGDEIAAVTSAVRTDERAGPAVMLTGIAALAKWRDRGVEQLLVSTIVDAAFADGVELAHLYPPDPDPWTSMHFVEVPGFEVRVVRP